MTYDPTRQWTIPATELTLANSNEYFIYLKAPIDPAVTTAELFTDESHIDPLRDTGFIIYKWGSVGAAVGGKRDVKMLWGNVRYRNGLSAYEVAVVNGFVGTQAEWLASLVGADGRQPEFSVQSGWLCWRYVGDTTWTQLYQLPTSWNNAVQSLSGTTPVLNVANGLNATLTLSGNTTITLSNLVAGMSGNLTVTNPSAVYSLTVAGYTNKISASVYVSANVMLTSGSSKIDMYSWYYDGTYLVWNGSQDYK